MDLQGITSTVARELLAVLAPSYDMNELEENLSRARVEFRTCRSRSEQVHVDGERRDTTGIDLAEKRAM